MSVVINSNAAATVASNNLAASNTALQKSLNRLSSGSKIVAPSDDAGGLAVSMKLSAAARRQGAVENNIASATSLLQTQDGVLSVTAKILNRISELKVLNADVTKSSSDRANYNAEFKALQSQLTANGGEKFNGVGLFGTTDLSVRVTEDGNTSVTAKAIDMLGTGASSTPGFATFSDTFADLSHWTDTSASGTVTPGASLQFSNWGAPGTLASVTSTGTFSGPFEITAKIQTPPGGITNLVVKFGSTTLTNDTTSGDLGPLMDFAWHDLKITVDASGNATTSVDGNVFASQNKSGVDTTSPAAIFIGAGDNSLGVKNFSIKSLSSTPGASGNIADVAGATDLSSLGLSTITDAIKDTATYRAQNGATQSRLGFASELVTVNKANLEAANSRITDVDVAQESTVLARNNVLVSAGTSMLAQANQSSQLALKLLS